jgi:hypothetical protein
MPRTPQPGQQALSSTTPLQPPFDPAELNTESERHMRSANNYLHTSNRGTPVTRSATTTGPAQSPATTTVSRAGPGDGNQAVKTPSQQSARPAPPPAAVNSIPRLTQGTGHMRTYFTKASDAYTTLTTTSVQIERNFVSAFIRGIRDSRNRAKLISQLEQTFPTRVTKDNRVEVRCEWVDIEEALLQARLMVKEGEPSRKRARFQ